MDRASVVALLHRAPLGFESLSLVPTALLPLTSPSVGSATCRQCWHPRQKRQSGWAELAEPGHRLWPRCRAVGFLHALAGLPSYTSEVMLSVDVAVAIALVVAFALVMWVLYMALAVLIVHPVSKMARFWKDWRFSRRF